MTSLSDVISKSCAYSANVMIHMFHYCVLIVADSQAMQWMGAFVYGFKISPHVSKVAHMFTTRCALIRFRTVLHAHRHL